jgi:ribonucleoside-diphosphate reductase alpha chain
MSNEARGLSGFRHFTKPGEDPFASVEWKRVPVKVGSYEHPGFEAPASWSQNALNTVASRYALKPIGSFPGEDSVRQIIGRVARTFQAWGLEHGYFATAEDAQAFGDELAFLFLTQRLSPNSPVWFNVGRWHAYGLAGQGKAWRFDPKQDRVAAIENAYEYPQMSACFIQPVGDSLLGSGGMMDLQRSEVQLFKYGSGTGTNFSGVRGRGECLTGGGSSSGLMSFLRGFDSWAGAIKSGGTTRRAAKMVIVDANHPEVEEFVTWKAREEDKVLALIRAGYDPGFEGEAYGTVSGQNSNNSVRLPDAFMEAVLADGPWNLVRRTDGTTHKTVRARDLWRLIAQSAHRCGDPGVMFDAAIQKWHTCKADGPIFGCNPCSEYWARDNTSCNLASLNLLKFHAEGRLDIPAFTHAVRIAVTCMDLAIECGSFPTPDLAVGTVQYRTVGLGYANVGGLLMVKGLPYGSAEARAYVAGLTSLMAGYAYLASAELARTLGAFPRFEANRDCMLDVMRMHRDANQALLATGSPIPDRLTGPSAIPADSPELATLAAVAWDRVVEEGSQSGFRNSQTVVIAPTGTIALMMDCATTGIEPAFQLVSYKHLAGGGTLKLVVDTIAPALQRLGYNDEARAAILEHVERTGSIAGATGLRTPDAEVFRTANDPQGNVLPWQDHLYMTAAIQPFLSGGVSKTINLPEAASVDDVEAAYLLAWRLGLKSTALYRDNCKASQPLNGSPQAAAQPRAEMTENEVMGLIQERFPHLARGWRRPIPYRYAVIKEFSLKCGGVRHFVTLKFDPNGNGRLRLYEVHWKAGQAGDVLHEFASKLSEEWSRRLRADEPPLVIASEQIGSAGLGGGMVDHELVKTATSGGDLAWKLIALEVYGKTTFVLPELLDAYMARPGRRAFIHEELGFEQGRTLRPGETRLSDFAAEEGPLDLHEDLLALKCPNCGVTGQIRRSGTCKTCRECGESIGGC